ncbi:MAG: RDD family protein [Steroidobacteraceae bacterium]
MDAQQPQSANPYSPPQAPVQDPLATDQVLAGRGARLGAVFLDGLIWSVAVYAPLLATGLTGTLLAFQRTRTVQIAGSLAVGMLIAAVAFVALAVITIILVNRNGQTIAKKLVGIKVVRKDGSKASLGRIFWLRNVINGVIGAIPLVGYVYTLADALMIFGESRQCLHDKLADTIVVNV